MTHHAKSKRSELIKHAHELHFLPFQRLDMQATVVYNPVIIGRMTDCVFNFVKGLFRRLSWSRLYFRLPLSISRRVVSKSAQFERIGPICLPLSVKGHAEPINFSLYYFGSYQTGHDYFVLTPGTWESLKSPLVRVSSSCIWAFVFNSVRCDCLWEFEEAKRRALDEPGGNSLLVYAASQHGKGIPGGLRGHALIYALGQAASEDLVYAAYKHNGFKVDYRSYTDVGAILAQLNINSLRLLTNSPDRLRALKALGFHVEHVPLEKPYEAWDAEELGVKQHRFGHLLSLPGFKASDITRYGLDPQKVFVPSETQKTEQLK